MWDPPYSMIDILIKPIEHRPDFRFVLCSSMRLGRLPLKRQEWWPTIPRCSAEQLSIPSYLIPVYTSCFSTSTIRSPNSTVPTLPPKSAVLNPRPPLSGRSRTVLTAVSMALAGFSSPSEYLSSIAALRMVPMGFAMPFPAMSGAEP